MVFLTAGFARAFLRNVSIELKSLKRQTKAEEERPFSAFVCLLIKAL
jgi:hypothetical protein